MKHSWPSVTKVDKISPVCHSDHIHFVQCELREESSRFLPSAEKTITGEES